MFCELVIHGVHQEMDDYKWLSRVHDRILEEHLMQLMKVVESIDTAVRLLPAAESEEQVLQSLRRCKELIDTESPDEEDAAEVPNS